MIKINSFTDLVACYKSYCLTFLIYKTSDLFFNDKRCSFINQILQSVVVSFNKIEDFSNQTKKERAWFYLISKSWPIKLPNQGLIAKEVDYIFFEKFDRIAKITCRVYKLINGLIKSEPLSIKQTFINKSLITSLFAWPNYSESYILDTSRHIHHDRY